MERGVRAAKPYVKEDMMSAYLLCGGIIGLVFGIAYVANLKYTKPVACLLGFWSMWFFNENIGPGTAAIFAIAALVGAAIVIAPSELLRSKPRRSYRIGSDVR